MKVVTRLREHAGRYMPLARGDKLMLDYDELEEIAREEDDESIEISLGGLQEAELSRLPEGITFLIFESDFPETSLWRENDKIVAEITEHIYTKYWWHKYHARSFVDAMERAVRRLENEGHPVSNPSIDSEDDIHIFVHWQVCLPLNISIDNLIESVKAAFDLVWERANSILENSDSVLILGKDTGEGLERLKYIAQRLEELGYYPSEVSHPSKPQFL